MRLLIDGYNLMHAAGRMKKRFGPDGLRRTRHRFLNELAAKLGSDQTAETTIVFDASSLPFGQSAVSLHKGMTVIFAIDVDEADTRIEELIAADSAPKSLAVISTDRRIRKAALRRRATAIVSDDFLDLLDSWPYIEHPVPSEPTPEELAKEIGLSDAEAAKWIDEFADLEENQFVLAIPDERGSALAPTASLEHPVVETASRPAKSLFDNAPDAIPADWTDAEMDRIIHEVEHEDLNRLI